MRIFKLFLGIVAISTVLFGVGRTIIGNGNIQRGNTEVTGMLQKQFTAADGFTTQIQGTTGAGLTFEAQAICTPQETTVTITAPLHLADTTYTVCDGKLSISREGKTYATQGRLSGKAAALMLRSPAFVLGPLQNSTPSIQNGFAIYDNQMVDGQEDVTCQVMVDLATMQPVQVQLQGGGNDCILYFTDFTLTQSSSDTT